MTTDATTPCAPNVQAAVNYFTAQIHVMPFFKAININAKGEFEIAHGEKVVKVSAPELPPVELAVRNGVVDLGRPIFQTADPISVATVDALLKAQEAIREYQASPASVSDDSLLALGKYTPTLIEEEIAAYPFEEGFAAKLAAKIFDIASRLETLSGFNRVFKDYIETFPEENREKNIAVMTSMKNSNELYNVVGSTIFRGNPDPRLSTKIFIGLTSSSPKIADRHPCVVDFGFFVYKDGVATVVENSLKIPQAHCFVLNMPVLGVLTITQP